MDLPHFIHLAVGAHLGYFYFLSSMNNVSLNICVKVFLHNFYLN